MFGEGIGLFADDDMIEGPHLYDIQGFLDPRGDGPVRLTGLGIAGRMIMAQDAGGGVVIQSRLDDFAGKDARAVDGAPEQLLKGQHPVFVVQPEHGEDFMLQRAEPKPQEFHGIGRGSNRHATGEAAIDFRERRLKDFIPGGEAIAPAVVLDHQRAVIEFPLQHPFSSRPSRPALLVVATPET